MIPSGVGATFVAAVNGLLAGRHGNVRRPAAAGHGVGIRADEKGFGRQDSRGLVYRQRGIVFDNFNVAERFNGVLAEKTGEKTVHRVVVADLFEWLFGKRILDRHHDGGGR